MLLPQKVLDDIALYKSSLSSFLAGEMQDAFFRGIRVPWGFYSQRGGRLLMARLRVPNGVLTPHQLRRIGEAANTYADGTLHITTRQDIQIHNLPAQNTLKLIEDLAQVQISPRAGGGNTIRNITGCYRSGICAREHREVYRTVWGLTGYLLSLDESYTMPRKIKIAFSGCEQDCACTGVNDMGFVAHHDGFKVLCGGGMGARSAVGRVLHESIEERDIGYTVRSVLNLFNTHGNRKKRHHNRLRFLIQDLGWERFRQLYQDELRRVKESEHIVLKTGDGLPHLPPETAHPERDDRCREDKSYATFLAHHTETQKQQGYHSVHLRVPMGEISADTLISLSRLDEAVPTLSFRTTQRQDMIIANVPAGKLSPVYEKVKNLFDLAPSAAAITDITCCKGATTCNLGICNTMGLASELLLKLGHTRLDPGITKQLMININGCPNACGQHPIGLIGFSGMVKKVFNRSVPFYRIHLGGSIDAEKTALAEPVGTAPARAIPAILCEFIAALQDSSAGREVCHYVSTRGRELMRSLVEKHAYVPPYEEDPSCYRDFGKAGDFSLAGLTQGECGSGVIDMIESDLESAGQLLAQARGKDPDFGVLKSTLLFSSRSLLVVKGLDPRDEREIINAFVEKFVDTGICSPEFKNLMDVFEGIVTATIPGKNASDYVTGLYEEVRATYARIDSNFNFPVRHLREPREQASAAAKPGAPAVYDLRGTPCPINYVKIKLRLEALQRGDVLEVYLDEGEPISSVPASLQNDGQEILRTEKADNYYKVTVRKRR